MIEKERDAKPELEVKHLQNLLQEVSQKLDTASVTVTCPTPSSALRRFGE